MTMQIREAVRLLAELAAPGALLQVPRELLLDLLAGVPCQVVSSAAEPDLTTVEVAAHFKRSPTTVRAWLEAGLIPGAYKLRGRAWRVPPKSLKAMSSEAPRTIPRGPKPTPVTPLDAWRRSA